MFLIILLVLCWLSQSQTGVDVKGKWLIFKRFISRIANDLKVQQNLDIVTGRYSRSRNYN